MTDRERITEILKAYTKKHNISASSVILEEYAEELVANGVIVPPCKVGDVVYVIYNNKIIKGKVDSFDVVIEENETSYVAGVKFFDQIAIIKRFSFGLNVFLTKEEAEEKLKELKENV